MSTYGEAHPVDNEVSVAGPDGVEAALREYFGLAQLFHHERSPEGELAMRSAEGSVSNSEEPSGDLGSVESDPPPALRGSKRSAVTSAGGCLRRADRSATRPCIEQRLDRRLEHPVHAADMPGAARLRAQRDLVPSRDEQAPELDSRPDEAHVFGPSALGVADEGGAARLVHRRPSYFELVLEQLGPGLEVLDRVGAILPTKVPRWDVPKDPPIVEVLEMSQVRVGQAQGKQAIDDVIDRKSAVRTVVDRLSGPVAVTLHRAAVNFFSTLRGHRLGEMPAVTAAHVTPGKGVAVA